MKSETLGSSTSVVDVTHIDTRGLWLCVDGREHYMPFDTFPWFAEATVKQMAHVERLGADHMHWPELDVDLTLHMKDSLTRVTAVLNGETPDRAPLFDLLRNDAVLEHFAGEPLTQETADEVVYAAYAPAIDATRPMVRIPAQEAIATLDDAVFFQCANLLRVYFTSNAPTPGAALFYGAANAVVYYLPNTTGSLIFHDSASTNHPACFYRIAGP